MNDTNIVPFNGADAAEALPTIVDPIAAPEGGGTCYIAGPMTGYPEYNFASFLATASILEQSGWTVKNPAQNDLDSGFDPRSEVPPTQEQVKAFMAWDIEQVMTVDKVFTLQGWMSSRGAVAEVALAQWRGIPVHQIAIGKDPETRQIQLGVGPLAPSISEICSHVEQAGANL